MTTISNIAQRILDENGYSLTDFSGLTLTILEYKIDDAIDYINLQAGLSMADLSGSPESKSITATDGQIVVVKWLTNLFLQAYKDKGTQVGIQGTNITQVVNNADFQVSTMITKAIERLKEPPIYVTNDPVE